MSSDLTSHSDHDPDVDPGSTRGAGFRRAILRGLGVVLPPLLTIVVLIWAWNTIESYVLGPIEYRIRQAIVWKIEDTLTEVPPGAISINERRLDGFTYKGQRYVPDSTGRRFFPEYVKTIVDERVDYFGPFSPPPASAKAYWHRYVELDYMPRTLVVPVFLIVFTTALYFLGRLFTFGLGRWFVHAFDRTILSIPVVNKVYGSVKQVTDFAFSERDIEFNRVVAIQYPSQGIWSLGFVTGNSMSEISEAIGEPMLSVLMPTSPMPMTGFTVTVKRSEAIDLNLTIDEAIQFIVSCGVVVPPQQRVERPVSKGKAAPNALQLKPGPGGVPAPNTPSNS
ncbi:hypothetical protein K227x_11960 [Rubripirellula lacrimiformis]|uniref:DUF502 domain-containing protein n=1 Tax=Rubripirellula lacrimiformis TaxID=1930273 RepID=A0A517N749_9BACT|nr:DUF502 domain-containing protein [Rubripirellula lacrimiformis]QDT02818.1 hypothetical protein K227x_11960 [Rubripirellula lacrimiformis]